MRSTKHSILVTRTNYLQFHCVSNVTVHFMGNVPLQLCKPRILPRNRFRCTWQQFTPSSQCSTDPAKTMYLRHSKGGHNKSLVFVYDWNHPVCPCVCLSVFPSIHLYGFVQSITRSSFDESCSNFKFLLVIIRHCATVILVIFVGRKKVTAFQLI